MRPLALIVVDAGGRGRAAIVAATTAVASGLLLVAVSIVRLGEPGAVVATGPGRLFAPIAEPGTRPGAVLAIVLMLVPIFLLLDQAVRLGSTSRRKRYAGLAVAGATRSDLRRWAALEVGAPAAAGAVLGIPVWLLLRELLGHQLAASNRAYLVPIEVGPGWWTLLVVAVIAAYGLLVGRRSARHLSDLMAGARGEPKPPRAWPALFLVLGMVLIGVFGENAVAPFAFVVCIVIGVAGLAPWTTYRSALVLAGRARSATTLLAARRLARDARTTGRAAAAVGAIALTGGVLGGFVAEIRSSYGPYDRQDYLDPAAVVGVCAALALVVVAASLAVHSAETLLERRRELAGLVAAGVPTAVVTAAHRRECLVATLPLTVACSLVGGLGYTLLIGAADARATAYVAAAAVLTTLAVTGAVWVTTLLLRGLLVEATDAEHLRTT